MDHQVEAEARCKANMVVGGWWLVVGGLEKLTTTAELS